MLARSDQEIAETLSLFNEHELDVTLLVPTPTGLEKAIMDATETVRAYLSATGCHDFGTQPQGTENKRVVSAFYVHPDKLEETQASLYRPTTKSGDPRIWFYGLKNYAKEFNLLAIFFLDNALYIVNCSRAEVLDSISDPTSPLGQLAARGRSIEDPVAIELLGKLREVGSMGFTRTLRKGPTGVGMTLETLLGISANSSKAPDYKGIEIKASRTKRKGSKNRITLFSQVPDWKLSPIGSAWNLLQTYGYVRNGRLQLYHQMDAVRPNSLGFVLEVKSSRGLLVQNHVHNATHDHVASWELEKLRNRLGEKHPKTFWVKANTRGRGEDEEFSYTEAVYTRLPKVWNFDLLVEAGTITLDYTISDKDGRARDHGYLYKIHPDNLEALFPPPHIYSLT